MRYFVLYDDVGTAQRLAQSDSVGEIAQYLAAGFVEIAQDLFEQLSESVEVITIASLPLLLQAINALSSIASSRRAAATELADNRTALDRLEAASGTRMRDITQAYADEDISLDVWYARMSRAINANITAGRALAVGGIANLDAQDRQSIELQTDEQLRYLNGFRRELADGNITPAQALARAQLYRGSAVIAYERAQQTALGLPLLPAQPKVRTACQANCKCRWDIQRLDGDGNWDCYWRLSPVESCETCLTRGRVFNPLQIRNGVIQSFNPLGIYARR